MDPDGWGLIGLLASRYELSATIELLLREVAKAGPKKPNGRPGSRACESCVF
jgi:hypothetical protein